MLALSGNALSVSPSTAAIDVGSGLSLAVSGAPANQTCQWASTDESVLETVGSGNFVAKTPGTATVRVACGSNAGTASIAVSSPAAKTIKITKGGTYTGNWSSDDPATPAVSINTDEPVTIANSVVTGRGNLIAASGKKTGGNVTITNTTGIGLDPMMAGQARGMFVTAENVNSLTVRNCTIRGTSFGVYLAGSTLTALSITNNVGVDLDDRTSDGMGGTLLNKRVLGHFIILNHNVLVNGGEIAWNQIINSPSKASLEDIINVYESHAMTSNAPLSIHDNYLEGAFAAGQTTPYTGTGIQFDGDTNDLNLASGFADVQNNVVVRTQNTGISIGAGHDISITNNRVVSCGQDGTGLWDNHWGSGFVLWNYYNTNQFFNNTVSGNTGGLVITALDKQVNANLYAPSVSEQLKNRANDNHFDNPCWAGDVVSQDAEAVERSAWLDRVGKAEQTLGAKL